MIGLFGDGSVGSPSVPVQIGGTVGRHTDGQDAAWQTLVLMLGLGLILGSAVLMYVVVQRSRTLARRRARAALAMHGAEHVIDSGTDGGTNGRIKSGTNGGTDTRTAQPEPERHSEEVPASQRQSPTEPAATPQPESSGRQPPESLATEDASTAEASTSDATGTATTATATATTATTTTTPTTTAANPRHHRRPRVTA